MRLSIIMSAYNNEHTILEAIESILNQTFGNFEFIIVNDGSKDNTLDIINQYQTKDNRIVLINQENQGLTRSLNVAISHAQGEYIARQDADDISLPERFQRQIIFLEKYKEIGFVGCSCEIIDEKGKFLNFIHIKNAPKRNASRLQKNNIFCHGSMMFRRELLNKISGYREFFKYSQDYDLYLRLIEFTLPGSINKALYRRRITLESISIQKVNLQAAYVNLARKCYEARLLKQDDNTFLKEGFLTHPCKSASIYDFVLPFMKSLYYIKHNDIVRGRIIMRPYLFPLRMNKYKLYILWLFSYIPVSMRNAIFTIKDNLRKTKIAINILR